MRVLRWLAVAVVFAIIYGDQSNRTHAAFDEPVPCAGLPALTGDVTTSAGSCATTGAWHKISTQTASAGASIQWTGLGSTYNYYFLTCNGLYPTTNLTIINLQLGEGATPTWETSNYHLGGFYLTTVPGTLAAQGTDSGAGFDVTIGGPQNSPVAGTVSVDVFIANFASTTIYTTVRLRVTVQNTGVTTYYLSDSSGVYSGDTNAKTAIRLIPTTGNVTGTCSLWGIATP